MNILPYVRSYVKKYVHVNVALTEVYLLSFFQAMLTNANKFLQRDEPLTHVLKYHLTHLILGCNVEIYQPLSGSTVIPG